MYMDLGLEMVDPQLKRNLGACLVMVRVKDGSDKAGHDTINKIYEERVGFKCKAIINATTSERAAKGMSAMFNKDADVCDIHD